MAIVRGLYRVHDLIILDEPTAAIDPTHRLGSAKNADRIIVMDEGRIIEIGTHEELLNAKGKYSMMYAAQAGWYEN